MDSNFKLRITEELKNVVNKIDIDTETFLLNNNLQTELINQKRQIMINEIENITRNYLLENFRNENLEQDKKYCIYIERDCILLDTKNHNRIGLLIITDFYVPNDYTDLLKKMYPLVVHKYTQDGIKFERLIIDKIFLDNLLLIKEIRSSVMKNSDIIYFESSNYKNANELKLFNLDRLLFSFDLTQSLFSKYSNLKVLILNRVYLTTIGNNFIDVNSLEELDLNSNNIVLLEKDAFNHLINLKRLNLSKNHILNIAAGTFDNLEQLTELNLSENKLDIIKNGIFHKLANLISMDLSHNNINKIDVNVFDGLSKLEDLKLNTKRLLMFDDGSLNALTNLKILTMLFSNRFSNQIKVELGENLRELNLACTAENPEMLNSVSKLQHLTKLQLCVSFQILDVSFFKNLLNLEDLTLECMALNLNKFPSLMTKLNIIILNDMEFLMDTNELFQDLSNLEEIQISNSKSINNFNIKNLLLKSKNLKRFLFSREFLRDNTGQDHSQHTEMRSLGRYVLQKKFKKIEEFNESNLVELDLNSLHIKQDDILSFKNLVHLEKINLSRNHLETLNNNLLFKGLFNLRVLDLSGSYLREINENVFSYDLKNLEYLCLSNNHLTSISENLFASLINLRVLLIDSNQLAAIHPNAFNSLTTLEQINLCENSLRALSLEVFKKAKNLKKINLCSNQIESVDQLFTQLLKIEEILLEDNQIRSICLSELFDFGYLINLDLRYNQIEHIPLRQINYFMNRKEEITILKLENNPIMNKISKTSFNYVLK